MRNKFLTLVENNITRYTNGGILLGDVVKLIKGYRTHPHFKDFPKAFQDEVEHFFNSSDLNKRIVNINTKYPSNQPNNDDNRGLDYYVSVAAEIAPGRFDKDRKITVPYAILEVIPVDGNNLNPIPASLRKKEKINHKPERPEEDEEIPNNPYLHTLMSQDGNKLTRGDRTLNNVNVEIPSSPAVGMKNPEVKGFSKVYTKLPTKIK